MLSGKYIYANTTDTKDPLVKGPLWTDRNDCSGAHVLGCKFTDSYQKTIYVRIIETKIVTATYTSTGLVTATTYSRTLQRTSGEQYYAMTAGINAVQSGSGSQSQTVDIDSTSYNSGSTDIYLNGVLCATIPLSSKQIQTVTVSNGSTTSSTIQQAGSDVAVTYTYEGVGYANLLTGAAGLNVYIDQIYHMSESTTPACNVGYTCSSDTCTSKTCINYNCSTTYSCNTGFACSTYNGCSDYIICTEYSPSSSCSSDTCPNYYYCTGNSCSTHTECKNYRCHQYSCSTFSPDNCGDYECDAFSNSGTYSCSSDASCYSYACTGTYSCSNKSCLFFGCNYYINEDCTTFNCGAGYNCASGSYSYCSYDESCHTYIICSTKSSCTSNSTCDKDSACSTYNICPSNGGCSSNTYCSSFDGCTSRSSCGSNGSCSGVSTCTSGNNV